MGRQPLFLLRLGGHSKEAGDVVGSAVAVGWATGSSTATGTPPRGNARTSGRLA